MTVNKTAEVKAQKGRGRSRPGQVQPMTLIPVDSTVIQAVGYDEESRRLEVVFNSGEVYCYVDVPPEVYHRLLTADSKGSYLQAYVIDVYPYRHSSCG